MIERRPPPLLLALESATSSLSVALLRGSEVVDEVSAPLGPAAETLLPAIDTLLGRERFSEAGAILSSTSDEPEFLERRLRWQIAIADAAGARRTLAELERRK